ncbi:L,D-transpeptidase family protein [Geotalea daltonii]|uniref:L,D-transpeptidase family protein n=1 Tax=Geotalea daltonii TaxID=1203471 RepID=UPI002E13FF8E|nr:L,D-transpeptidase family protein [Geotalea daltonii]
MSLLSHSSPSDVAQAKARGVSPGGDVMIHGLPNALGFVGKLHLIRDWTLGCVAVTNPEIEEIWRVVPDGVVVEIVP